MKKHVSRGMAAAAFAGMVLTLHAQDTTSDQSQFPTILQQPVDNCVPVGSPVTFSVVATNADTYQWFLNNVALDGQTNSSFTIPSTGVGNVGYYFASVVKGTEVVPTRSACLNVYIASMPSAPTSTRFGVKTMSMSMAAQTFDMGGGGPIVVFGAPVFSSGGTGTCPGKYAGYVNFTKTASQGWGWSPSTNANIFTATDTNRADTRIQYGGDYGDNGCAPTTVTLQNPPMSPVYRFAIFFPVGSQVPTNAYPITLSGFDP